MTRLSLSRWLACLFPLSTVGGGCSHLKGSVPVQEAYPNHSGLKVVPGLVTSNVLRRTFKILYSDVIGTGTAFALEENNRQYLITAKHVIQGLEKSGVIRVSNDDKWIDLPCELVGLGEGDLDIAVLAPLRQIAPILPIQAGGITPISSECRFLGFPLGLGMRSGALNADYPIPLVKSCLVSAFFFGPDGKTVGYYLDGINNPGFSGGPVVDTNSTPERIIGVISAYKWNGEAIFDNDGVSAKYFYKANTGIIVAFDIRLALELIRKNPIGFNIESSTK